jgi:tRNA 2-thiouridine synthesizing protein E
MTNPILSTINGKQLIEDHYGNLVEIDEWSHDIAREMARAEGVVLTEDHLRVLDYLREYVIQHGGSREDAHQILRTLEGRFAAEGGGRWLFTLFPGGPVRQGMRFAGLPEAAHAADPSFGTVS